MPRFDLRSVCAAFALIAAASCCAQAPLAATSEKPAALVSTMMAHYAGAQSLSGTIDLIQTANGASIEVKTQIIYKRPSLIYLSQSRTGSNPKTISLISDGKMFSYDPPSTLYPAPKKFIEKVDSPYGKQTIADMFAAMKATLIDDSLPLDVAIGRLPDLRFVQAMLATLISGGVKTVRGVQCAKIVGQWRGSLHRPPGKYELDVSTAGDLMRFLLHQTIVIPVGKTSRSFDVISVWNVDLTPNAPVDTSYFNLSRG